MEQRYYPKESSAMTNTDTNNYWLSATPPIAPGFRARITMTGESGATLIVALLLLLIMSMLAVTGVRTVTLEEKMASSAYDRNIIFQSVEAALRLGEEQAEAESKTGPYNSGFPNYGIYVDNNDNCPGNAITNCSNGLCPQPDKDCQPRWENPSFLDDDNQWAVASLSVGGLAGNPPKYIVEWLGASFPCREGDPNPANNQCHRYRVTARSNAGEGRAAVTLQSIYATD
jgi:type IV pilus assembly protein PilX